MALYCCVLYSTGARCTTFCFLPTLQQYSDKSTNKLWASKTVAEWPCFLVIKESVILYAPLSDHYMMS
jgi:hypothetical protein